MGERPGTDARRSGLALGLLFGVMMIGGVVFALYAMRHWWFPPVGSVLGREIDRLFLVVWSLIGVVFILVQGALAYFVWRFSRNAEAAYWHDDRRLELLWTVIPAAGLTVLTIVAAGLWLSVQQIGPWGRPAAPEAVLVVQVRGEQFGWRARYPGPDGQFGRTNPGLISSQNPFGLDPSDPAGRDDVVTIGEVHLVVDRPTEVRLNSRDVIHSFFVPVFRVKQDAVPGMTTRALFTPTRAGEFDVECAELCGVGHYIMRGRVVVQTQAEFDRWMQGQRAARRP